jgi:prepilin-type N-terminal cleavage/methylation domain-containing protein
MIFMKHKLSKKQEGFTIIELLIATSVLAVILVIVTLILISISGLYDKGVHLSTIQDNTRDTIEEIGQDIQLTNGTFTIGSDSGQISGFPAGAHSQAFCIGDTRYTYVLGYAEGTGYESTSDTPLINHVLWRDNQAQDPNSCQALSLNQSNPDTSDTIPGNSTNGVELVAPGTRLTNLSVIQNPNGAYVI